MRKYFNFGVIVMLLLALCVNLSSCSKDDDEGDNGGGGGNPAIEGIVWEKSDGSSYYFYFEKGEFKELYITGAGYTYTPRGKYVYDKINSVNNSKFTLHGDSLKRTIYHGSSEDNYTEYKTEYYVKSTEFKTWKDLVNYINTEKIRNGGYWTIE